MNDSDQLCLAQMLDELEREMRDDLYTGKVCKVEAEFEKDRKGLLLIVRLREYEYHIRPNSIERGRL